MPKKDSEKKPGEENKELLETLQRVQAEFENYKKRVEKEKLQLLYLGKAKAIAEVLPLLDSFDAAEKKLEKEQKKDNGLELLHKQFLQAMQKLGLQGIKAVGEIFSHDLMECVIQESDRTKEDGIVLEEFQKGYLLDGIVLRHTKVKVNKIEKKEEKAEKEFAEEEKKE